MNLFFPSKTRYSAPITIQGRLLKLAALFLSIYSLTLTLSPIARLRSWNADLRWSHWLGFLIWVLSVLVVYHQISKLIPDADPYIFPICALLAGWGILTIWRLDPAFGIRQAAWLAVCSCLLFIGLRFEKMIGVLYRYKYIFLISGLFLTALTFFWGTNPGGSGLHLWLGCCGLYLQPSEPLKLLLVVFLAAYLADRIPLQANLFQLLLPSIFLTGIALSILLAQRDLGTASIFIFLYTAMVYLASGKKRLLLITIGLLAAAGLTGYFFVDIIQYRLTAWIDPWTDPSGRSYQVIQSILAVANGGIYGRGIGLGSPGLVPVAHSDFICTSIAEETGLIGTFALLIFMGIITTRGFKIAITAENHFYRLLSAGISTYFCAQSILIIGGNLRLLPLTGVTLPFVSYGGSSLLTSFLGLLALLLISNAAENEPLKLSISMPYKVMFSMMGLGLLACALANGWWGAYRSDNLLSRTDNPRRAISDRYVMRGAILDRKNRAINITKGQPGTFSRSYLDPALSPIVGYTHPVYGQAGLEASLDPYLRGIKGTPTIQTWWNNVLYGQSPKGLNIRISIDLDLQKNADSLLGNHTGAVILVNAQTGEILVMASHPTFDANQLDIIASPLSLSEETSFLNRATQAQYPVDDLLKPVLNSAFGDNSYTSAEKEKLFNLLGFYNASEINLSSAPGLSAGKVNQISLSPAQLISAIAAMSNGGICPAIQLTNSVEIPSQGWVILNPVYQKHECLPEAGINSEVSKLEINGTPFWGYSSSNQAQKKPFTWYAAGTIPNWQGPKLALLVIIEENNIYTAQSIGQTILKNTLQP